MSEEVIMNESRILTISEAITRVNTEPEIPVVWSGIKAGSFGFVFGPSKSGKTILCENLAMSLALNRVDFLGLPLLNQGNKVLFISMEEYISERTKRNDKQLSAMRVEKLENYLVINEKFPRFFSDKKELQHLYDIIKESKANLVFVDSLTRMAYGEIEDSSFCRNLGIALRDINRACNTTMIIVHHAPKLSGGSIGIDGVAGSRVLAQEADFLIGVNKTLGGVRYIKDVAFRYAQEKEEVLMFKINDSLWIESLGYSSEQSILKMEDGRVDETSKELIFSFISEKENVNTSELISEFVDNKIMGKTVLFDNIKNLVQQGKIRKPEKGLYSI